MRKNARHLPLITWKYFRVYYSGGYAWLEIDFGRTWIHEFVLLLGTEKKLVEWVYHRR